MVKTLNIENYAQLFKQIHCIQGMPTSFYTIFNGLDLGSGLQNQWKAKAGGSFSHTFLN